ncbi:MAG: hypothetical protein ACK46G_09790 [Flavobacteriales bacterium]|jgi:hypothetical protein
MQRTLLILAAAATMAGCSTDLDINAPYKDVTVVYGLLNMRDSVHYVKINKAFLGEGNAFTYAAIRDSNEYRDEDITQAVVYRVNSAGTPVDSFLLRDTLLTGRLPGDFYYPEQKVYYFNTPQRIINQSGSPQISSGPTFLFQNGIYKLKLRIKGKDVTSTSNIASDITIASNDQDTLNSASAINFMNPLGNGYGIYEFNWTSSISGIPWTNKRFVVNLDFKFDEVRDGVSQRIVKSRELGTVVASAASQPLAVTLAGETFYSWLRNSIPDDPAVDQRIFRGIDFRVDAANEDFHTYLTLTEPISSIVEDRPQYSNVDGAFGLWASRYYKNVVNKRLNPASLNELINGTYTATMRFCSGFNSGPPYGCN